VTEPPRNRYRTDRHGVTRIRPPGRYHGRDRCRYHRSAPTPTGRSPGARPPGRRAIRAGRCPDTGPGLG